MAGQGRAIIAKIKDSRSKTEETIIRTEQTLIRSRSSWAERNELRQWDLTLPGKWVVAAFIQTAIPVSLESGVGSRRHALAPIARCDVIRCDTEGVDHIRHCS